MRGGLGAAPSRGARALFLLWMVLLFGSFLRWRGLDSCLPVATEQDCKIPLQVELIEQGVAEPQTYPDFQYYPTLIAELALRLPRAERAPRDAPLARHLAAAGHSVLKSRLVVSVLALLAVPLTYLLARIYASQAVALCAAALCATSLLHLSFSQQARPHGASSATFLAACLGALALFRLGGWVGYALAGLGLAAALGTLQSGALCALAPFVAHILRVWRAEDSRSRWRRCFDPRALLVPGLGAAALFVFYPFWWDDQANQAELGHSGSTMLLGGHMIFGDLFNGAGARIVLRTLWFYDPALLIGTVLAGLLGLVALRRGAAALRSIRPESWILASFFVPYAALVLLYERTYERFLLPLIPLCAVLTARAFAAVLKQLHLHGALRTALGTLLCTATALCALQLSSVRAHPSTHAAAARWIEANLPAETDPPAPNAPRPIALFAPTLELPLWYAAPRLVDAHDPDVVLWHMWWSRYQARLAEGRGPAPRYPMVWIPPDLQALVLDPLRLLRESGADWAVVEVFAENRVHPGGTILRTMLMERARLAARFSPDMNPFAYEHPLGYQEESSVEPPHFLWRTLHARCMGPVLEIYDLRALLGTSATPDSAR